MVKVDSYLGRASGQSTQSFGGNASINITCNEESRTNSNASWNYGENWISANGWVNIQSETFEVEHDPDGTKKITISSSLSTNEFSPYSTSASGDI